jgi:glycosyltransferase involved in cell wall biosynthesis
VTNRAAIPEVVGDTGFYVGFNDPIETAEKIKLALMSDKGKAARERVKTLFPLEKRENEMIKVINEVFNKE